MSTGLSLINVCWMNDRESELEALTWSTPGSMGINMIITLSAEVIYNVGKGEFGRWRWWPAPPPSQVTMVKPKQYSTQILGLAWGRDVREHRGNNTVCLPVAYNLVGHIERQVEIRSLNGLPLTKCSPYFRQHPPHVIITCLLCFPVRYIWVAPLVPPEALGKSPLLMEPWCLHFFFF